MANPRRKVQNSFVMFNYWHRYHFKKYANNDYGKDDIWEECLKAATDANQGLLHQTLAHFFDVNIFISPTTSTSSTSSSPTPRLSLSASSAFSTETNSIVASRQVLLPKIWGNVKIGGLEYLLARTANRVTNLHEDISFRFVWQPGKRGSYSFSSSSGFIGSAIVQDLELY